MARSLNYADYESSPSSSEWEQVEINPIRDMFHQDDIENYFRNKLENLSGNENTGKDKTSLERVSDFGQKIDSQLNDFLTYLKDIQDADSESSSSKDENDYTDESSEDEAPNNPYYQKQVNPNRSFVNQKFSKSLDNLKLLNTADKKSPVQNNRSKLTLLDLDLKDLEARLSPKEIAQTKTQKKSQSHVMCHFCNETFEIRNNDFRTSYTAHKKSQVHLEAERKMRTNNAQAPALEEGISPKIIQRNENGDYICSVCENAVVGKSQKGVVMHCTGKMHQFMIKDRFPAQEPEKKREFKQPKPKQPESSKQKAEDSDNLVYAMGMASIQPISKNEMKCTMCEKTIPVATDYPSLMKNISQHIQGKLHLTKLAEVQKQLESLKVPKKVLEKTKTEKTQKAETKKPQKAETKKTQKAETKKPQKAETKEVDAYEDAYKFICLPCELNGYGHKFCKSHMKSPGHNNRTQTIQNASVNFDNGVKCGGCNKYVYGVMTDINIHCSNCMSSEKSNSRLYEKKAQKNTRNRYRSRKNSENKTSDDFVAVSDNASSKPDVKRRPRRHSTHNSKSEKVQNKSHADKTDHRKNISKLIQYFQSNVNKNLNS